MKIHFVTETKEQSWILRPMAERLASEIPGATLGTQVDPSVRANVFFNYALYKPTNTKTAAFFTHREIDVRGEDFDRIASKLDWCFAQSQRTALLLPAHKTSIIPTFPLSAAFYKKQLVLGVVGRGYSSGRKRMDWVEDIRSIEGVTVLETGGKLKAEEMPGFYRKIDYLLVLSDNEGGPQPVLEAIASCKPIIAPNVGYCWEYPCIRYTLKTELLEILSKLVLPRDGWRRSAAHLWHTLKRLM